MRHAIRNGMVCAAAVLAPAGVMAESAPTPTPAAVAAAREAAIVKTPCPLKEQANININFQSVEKTPQAARQAFDGQMKRVEQLAGDLGIKELNLQNYNFSLNPNYNGMSSGYQMSGNVSYQLEDAAKATTLLEKLNAEHMQANINVNAYNQGNCTYRR